MSAKRCCPRRLPRHLFVLAGPLVCLTIASLVGCSGSDCPAVVNNTDDQTPSSTDVVNDVPRSMIDGGAVESAMARVTATNPSSATEVITEFLDVVRRGDADQNSDRLLTTKARQELARIGHRFEPLGSPSAKFEVTRAENLPDAPGSALVHSFWADPVDGPASDGSGGQYKEPMQVVWAVQWERSAWRISGMAVQVEPGSPPLVLDFENGDAMARYLSPAPAAGQTDAAAAVSSNPASASVR